VAVNHRALTLLRQLANQVGAAADNTVRDLAGRWLTEWDRLAPAWQAAIAAVLAQHRRTGVWPAPWQIARIEAVARAQHDTAGTVTALLTEAAATTAAAAADVATAAAGTEPLIISAQLPTDAAVVTGAGVAGIVAATAVTAALTARQHRIAALHAAAVTETVAAARRVFTRPPARPDPVRAAAELTGRARHGFDAGLNRAATIARTELIDTYRDVAAAVHHDNRRHVTGWVWWCACDRRSCAACWAMHGTRHPLTEPGPLGHPGCRCTRLPLAGDTDPPTAEARFRRLPRTAQAHILGPARLALYRSGRVGWADLTARHTTNGWRPSYRARTVRDLTLLADRRAT
jgi:hypothetical protein